MIQEIFLIRDLVSAFLDFFKEHKQVLIVLGVMILTIFYIFGKTLGWL